MQIHPYPALRRGRMGSLLLLITATIANSLHAAEDREGVLQQEIPKLKGPYLAAELKPLGPETPLARIYYNRLNRRVRFMEKDLQSWPREPGAKFHKRDKSDEAAIRPNAKLAFSFAVLAAYGDFDEAKAGVPRAQVRADAIALLRYLAVTHLANFLPTDDGKPWGDHWQSAYWAAYVGDAAWLLWNDLPDDMKVMIARLVIHEADRFNTRPPDSGEVGDTKSEENAWNSEIMALATCMFPQHPNAKLWRERAIVYMVNSYSTAADSLDNRLLDGKPLRDWMTTTNIHPDFTMENHDRMHPDYISCFSLNLRNADVFALAGTSPPQAMLHHARDCNDVLMHLTATNGSLFYVNGQDWWPHRHEVPLIAEAEAGMLLRDADAAGLELGALNWVERMHDRFNDGRALDLRQCSTPTAEEELIAAYAGNYLLHRLFGDLPHPSSPAEIQRHQSGTRIFEAGGFVTHRTSGKFVSFCWVNDVMGLVYPAEDTWFTAPEKLSFVGWIEAEGVSNTVPKVLAHKVVKLEGTGSNSNPGFSFVGKLSRCEGRIEQRLALVSLPENPVLYVEQLSAIQPVNMRTVATATVSILNEDSPPLASNERHLWMAGGEVVMRGARDENPERHFWDTTWVNLDNKLGIDAHASGRMSYLETHRYRRARLAQELAANYLTDIGPRKPGEIISEAVVELLPNAAHSNRGNLRVTREGKAGFLIQEGAWQVLVNLGETNILIQSSGQTIDLPGLSATVRRATR